VAGELKPYERVLSEARDQLKRELGGGQASAHMIAVSRGSVALMERELKTQPGAVLRFSSMRRLGWTGPDLWRMTCRETAAKPFQRDLADPVAWKAKMAEYEVLVEQIRKRFALDHAFHDKLNGVVYVTQDNAEVSAVLTEIIRALSKWVAVHGPDPNFMQQSAQASLHTMLSERNDLVEMLRVAQSLPKDTSIWRVPIDRPAMVEVVEIGISFVPYVGTAITLFEVATGRDLFGYQLDPVDRSILAAGALLPFAARFVKGGRALYTAGRLERLYGRDASRFTRILGVGEKMSADPRFMSRVREARKLTISGQKADARTVTEIADALKRMDLKTAQPRVQSLSGAVSDAIKKLGSGKPILAELDAPALTRVLDKELKLHMRGQLLEEFLESRIMGWLRDPAGAAALGIDAKEVMFLPGHMLRHPTGGRQITDGVLVRRIGDTLEILAIFEAKSSVRAVRELRAAKTGVSTLTVADRAEIRKVAREELEEALERATSEGRTHTRSLADHEAELLKPMTQNEEGQIRRSIERLYENDDLGRLQTVRISGVETKIRLSPTKTKVFGVVPKNTDIPALEQACRSLGYDYEAIGMDVTPRELNGIVDAIAATRAPAP